jgi:hypothetical protein
VPDSQIFRGAVTDAPVNYELPDSVAFILKCVNADFTDDGAAAAWLPCVTILSDSGHVIARAVDQAVSVEAGGDAEVSWFPGVKNIGSGAGGAANLVWAVSHGSITIPNANNSSANSVQTVVSTNDSATFDLNNSELRIKAAGVYLIAATIFGNSTGAFDERVVDMTVNFNGSLLASYTKIIGGNLRAEFMATGQLPGRVIGIDVIKVANIRAADLNEGVYTSVTTFTTPGAAVTCNSFIGAVRLSDAIAGTIS